MKKIKKKPLKKKKTKKSSNKKKVKNLKVKKNKKNNKKISKNKKNKNKIGKNKKIIIPKKQSLIFKIIKLQRSLKPEFNFKINFNLERYIQAFFDIFANKILEYKVLKAEEERKIKLEKIEKKRKRENINLYTENKRRRISNQT